MEVKKVLDTTKMYNQTIVKMIAALKEKKLV